MMRGILLAGGTGSRLLPLTKTVNKHLLPVGGIPMLYHSLQQFKNCGVVKVMIITGTEHAGSIIQQVGSGKEFDMDISYKVQDKPLGIAHAIHLCKDFVGNNHCMVLLGDNIFEDNLSYARDNFLVSRGMALFVLHEVPDPERFGVAEIEGVHITKIEEKPKEPKSNYAVTGCYFYTEDVFNAIERVMLQGPSARGEYEISKVNQYYVDRGETAFIITKGFWSDAGTSESYKRANELTSLN
jgi:glucose-1-phosphate thymidylyltransferase